MSNKHKEYKGKTIDEAIAAACHDLQAGREELEIEVLAAGSAGIFGLCRKKAVIQVRRKSVAQHHPESSPLAEGPSPQRGKRHGKPAKEQARPRATPDRRVEAPPQAEEVPAKAPSQEVLAEIKELTQTLLRLMGYPLAVTTSVQGNKVTAHISAEGQSAEIIGRDGSTLDAIQYLLRKIISQRFPEKIVLALDAGNYREDRQKELEELALEMARRVKETGKSEVMSALNPAERRIVHVTLQDDPTIRSSSIGEGLFKKVRIYLPGKGRKRPGGRTRGEAPGAEGPAES